MYQQFSKLWHLQSSLITWDNLNIENVYIEGMGLLLPTPQPFIREEEVNALAQIQIIFCVHIVRELF